jgi:hypothetical protein
LFAGGAIQEDIFPRRLMDVLRLLEEGTDESIPSSKAFD